MTLASVERRIAERHQPPTRLASCRRRVKRIKQVLRDLDLGRTPDLTGVRVDVEFVDEDGNEVDGPVEIDLGALRALLKAERADLQSEINWFVKHAPPTPSAAVRHHAPVVRTRTASRPRERRGRRRTRSCSSSSSSGDPSEPDPPGVARLERALRPARRSAA